MNGGRAEEWWSRLRREGRDWLEHVNGEPGPGWRPRTAHHGSRVLLLLAGALLLVLAFPRDPLPGFAALEEGEVAREDVIAEVGFPVPKEAARLAEEREEAERSVAPIFRREQSAVDTALRRMDRVFSVLDGLQPAAGRGRGAADTARVRRVMESFGLSPGPEQVEHLAEADHRGRLQALLEDAFRELLPRGVVPGADLSQVGAGRVVVRGPERDRLVDRDSLLTTGEFYSLAAERVPDDMPAAGVRLFQTLLVRLMEPSLRLDREATRGARLQARNAVEATAGYVLEGERIVTAHERVTEGQMERLEAYRQELVRRGMRIDGAGPRQWAGAGLYGVLLLGLLGLVLLFFRPAVYRDLRGFGIVVGLPVVVLAVASVVSGVGVASSLVPVAFAAILVAVLYDGLLALLAVTVTVALLAGQPPYQELAGPFLALAGGGAAALGVRGIRRRSDSWILIALITGAYAAAAGALVLLGAYDLEQMLEATGWGAANAAVSTVLAVGAVLPLLEKVTGITTEQTLLELSDLNHPLLRQLSREAPGTYAHSINTANLAEAACQAIGADALLARAGVYYHDIGKMRRPQFFIENQPRGRNPHDRIPPAKSAEVIRNHVTHGLAMAREAGLPAVIRDVIREHHGDMEIAYFLEKARQEADEGEEPEVEAYRYPGPRPRSRETAVVMLADGVESATRALPDPTPERIEEVIEGIAEDRRAAGQLDRCPLTLRDLEDAKQAFRRVLVGMYHHRVDYPEAPGEAARAEKGEGEPAPEAAPPREGSEAAARPRRPARSGRDGEEGAEEPEPERSWGPQA